MRFPWCADTGYTVHMKHKPVWKSLNGRYVSMAYKKKTRSRRGQQKICTFSILCVTINSIENEQRKKTPHSEHCASL